MISIKTQQIETIKNSKKQQFVKRAVHFLKEKYPHKTEEMDDKTLASVVESSINRANAYDIVTEQGIILFLELMFSLSLDFDTAPRTKWTHDILSDFNISESERIMKIINTLSKV